MEQTGYDIEDYTWSLAKMSTTVHVLNRIYFDMFFKETEKNGKAPNLKVLTADGKNEVNLVKVFD